MKMYFNSEIERIFPNKTDCIDCISFYQTIGMGFYGSAIIDVCSNPKFWYGMFSKCDHFEPYPTPKEKTEKEKINQQIKSIEDKIEALQEGDSKIHIESKGIESELEQIMASIINKIGCLPPEEKQEKIDTEIIEIMKIEIECLKNQIWWRDEYIKSLINQNI